MQEGWNTSDVQLFAGALETMGLPVTLSTESAAPRRYRHRSVLVRMMPSCPSR